MPKTKSLDRIVSKWTTVTPQRQAEYQDGVMNPRADWKTATLAAASQYQQGVQKAITNKSFDKGVAAAGSEKWQKNAFEKGPSRWAQGVQLGSENYQKGFAPYRAALEALPLPPRGPKGDPGNIQRVAAVAKALNDLKNNRSK